MISFAVLASGNGTNFQALIDGIASGEIRGVEIKVLITDKADAYALERAKKASIPSHILLKEKFKTREEMDLEIMRIADFYKVDYLYLLGYMRLIKAKEIFQKYKYRMINLHPSLLPAFPGINAQHQAFEYGCKISGITIHFLDEGVDTGPIIYQKAADISECMSGDEVVQKLRVLEHEGVKKIAQMLAKGKFEVKGRKVIYLSP